MGPEIYNTYMKFYISTKLWESFCPAVLRGVDHNDTKIMMQKFGYLLNANVAELYRVLKLFLPNIFM